MASELTIILIEKGDISYSTVKSYADGFMFHVSYLEETKDIDYGSINGRYVNKCDLIFESLFSLIEKKFSVQILNKGDVEVVDHYENTNEYCAANVDFNPTEVRGEFVIVNEKVVDMSKLIFREEQVNTAEDVNSFMPIPNNTFTFPIRNMKVSLCFWIFCCGFC